MDSYVVKTFIQSEATPLTTVMSEAPQLQTVMQDGLAPITTVVNAPWVAVTSVNGKTGDVVIEVKLGTFEPNHYYEQGTAILYNGYLYYAKQNFDSGTSFNADDWQAPDFDQVQADWNTTTTTAKSYIKNKPTKLSQFTNDLDLISEDEVAEIVKDRIEPLETDVEDLKGTVETVSTKTDTTAQSLSNLSTTVTNMKTDGSVTKLGTNTVGSTTQPVYWNSGEPATCNVGTSASNVDGALVRTNGSSNTYVGNTLHLKYNSTTTQNIYAGIDGVYTPKYFLQAGNNIVIDERSGWHLIDTKSFTSTKSGIQLLSIAVAAYPSPTYIYKIEYLVRAASTGRFYLGFTKGSTVIASSGSSWKRWGLHDNSFYTDNSNNGGSIQEGTLERFATMEGYAILYPDMANTNYYITSGLCYKTLTGGMQLEDAFNYRGEITTNGQFNHFVLCTGSSSVSAANGYMKVYAKKGSLL